MKKTALIFIMTAMMFIFASCGSENADNVNSTHKLCDGKRCCNI